ncbi:hypothetical protein LIA77_07168 [Sarocladium implicatum]|nr:hypothetical protein LIA77_07168 [Sarocladium implicatum]
MALPLPSSTDRQARLVIALYFGVHQPQRHLCWPPRLPASASTPSAKPTFILEPASSTGSPTRAAATGSPAATYNNIRSSPADLLLGYPCCSTPSTYAFNQHSIT